MSNAHAPVVSQQDVAFGEAVRVRNLSLSEQRYNLNANLPSYVVALVVVPILCAPGESVSAGVLVSLA